MQPPLTACLNGVASFASQFSAALPALQHSAADLEVDPGARPRLQHALALQSQAAAVQLAVTRQLALAIDSLRCTYARDFVSYVVDVDTVRAALPDEALARLQFRQLTDARQRLLGDAMAAIANVINALSSLESAWNTLAGHLGQLETQLREGELSAALLEARFKSARQDWSALAGISAHPPALRASSARPQTAGADGDPLHSVSAFRHQDISRGATAVAGAIDMIDNLAEGIAGFPAPDNGGVAAVVRHIDAAKRLANAWPQRGRPSLVGSLAALKHFGDAFVEVDALRLQNAFVRMAAGEADARQLAGELVSGLIARLDGLITAFESVTGDVNEYLAQMAGVSAKLNADTTVVTERLRAEHEKALALATKATSLQDQIVAAHARHRWHWMLGPLGMLVSQQIDLLSANLRGVSTQLSELQSAQAATMDDAAYLQSLLPALSTYLSGMDQIGAGIGAALCGTQTLQFQLADLKRVIEAAPEAALSANQQLLAALADWRDISSKIGQLPPG